jgi:hypothetical protein
MHCQKCNSLMNSQGLTCSQRMVYPFTDSQGKQHMHDVNRCVESFKCKNCNHTTSIPRYSKCWCGWTQKPN